MNKKRILFLLVTVVLLFSMSGCAIPTDESGKIILISLDTTFKEMFSGEGFFSALFVYPLSQIINYLTIRGLNVGLAIVIATVAINGLVLLLTLKQNISMQRMQMLQPEMDKITRKYEGKTDERSKMRQAQEVQQLYKKYDINPFGSFITLFIQFPVLIAMYHAVQRAEVVANGKFLGMSLEMTPLAGVKAGQFSFAFLYVLMLAAQFVSMKMPQWLTRYHGEKEAKEHQRSYHPAKNPMGSSMYFMLIFIGAIGVAWPTAMSLYWMISSCVQIVKSLVVDLIMNKQKKEQR